MALFAGACSQPFDDLKPPCGDSLAASPFGLQLREDGAWGLMVRDTTAEEGIADVKLVAELPGGASHELVSNSFGWVDWPESFEGEETVDLHLSDLRYRQAAWLGVPLGCVAIAPSEIPELGGSGVRLRPGPEVDWAEVSFEVDVSRLPRDDYLVHLQNWRSLDGSLRSFAAPAGRDRVVVQTDLPRGLEVQVVVKLTLASQPLPEPTWSNIRGWGARVVQVDSTQPVTRLDPMVVAAVEPRALEVVFPQTQWPDDIDDADHVYVAMERDHVYFTGAVAAVAADGRSLSIPAPVAKDADLDEFHLFVTGGNGDRHRSAQTRSVGGGRFEAYPLLPLRHAVRELDELVLTTRSDNAHLSWLDAGNGVSAFVFDNRARIRLNDAFQNAVSEGAQVSIQDVRFVAPLSLSEPEANNFAATSWALTYWRP